MAALKISPAPTRGGEFAFCYASSMALRRRFLGSVMLASMLVALISTGGCSGGDDSASSPGTDDGGSSGDAVANGDGALADGTVNLGDASQPAPDASTVDEMN